MLHHISLGVRDLPHAGLFYGAPGLRTDYGEHYHAAFLADPDGRRAEAVINRPQV